MIPVLFTLLGVTMPTSALARATATPYSGYVVETQPGSLPMGGTVQDTPVYALDAWPDGLHASLPASAPSARTDIDLGPQLAFVVDNVVSREGAQALIEIAEHFGFRPEAPGIATPPGMRMNLALHWMADRTLMDTIFRALAPHLPATLNGKALWPRLSERIDMYKYREGDEFRRHIDGTWPGYGVNASGDAIDTWPGSQSRLSMLLYLNDADDGVEGGATRLWGRNGATVDVQPRAGSALFFQHGFEIGSVMHAGLPVKGRAPKYVARINVLYDAD